MENLIVEISLYVKQWKNKTEKIYFVDENWFLFPAKYSNKPKIPIFSTHISHSFYFSGEGGSENVPGKRQ